MGGVDGDVLGREGEEEVGRSVGGRILVKYKVKIFLKKLHKKRKKSKICSYVELFLRGRMVEYGECTNRTICQLLLVDLITGFGFFFRIWKKYFDTK